MTHNHQDRDCINIKLFVHEIVSKPFISVDQKGELPLTKSQTLQEFYLNPEISQQVQL